VVATHCSYDNVNLLPGDKTLEELMDMAGEGYMFDINKNWSIDDKRLNFHFGSEAAWEIKNGKKGRLYKNPSYWGITPEFWNSLVAVAGPQEWRVWGLPNCGKENLDRSCVWHTAQLLRCLRT